MAQRNASPFQQLPHADLLLAAALDASLSSSSLRLRGLGWGEKARWGGVKSCGGNGGRETHAVITPFVERD